MGRKRIFIYYPYRVRWETINTISNEILSLSIAKTIVIARYFCEGKAGAIIIITSFSRGHSMKLPNQK